MPAYKEKTYLMGSFFTDTRKAKLNQSIMVVSYAVYTKKICLDNIRASPIDLFE